MIIMSWKDTLEFILKLDELNSKRKEIERQEVLANQSTGISQQILQSIVASEKQTIEVIKLTSIITILTIFLVIIGLSQLIITFFTLIK